MNEVQTQESRKVHDIYAFIAFSILYIYAYKDIFTNIKKINFSLSKLYDHVMTYGILMGITITFTVLLVLIFCSNPNAVMFFTFLTLPSLTVAFILYNYRNEQQIASVEVFQKIISPVLLFLCVVTLCLVYYYVLLENIDYSNELLHKSLKSYLRNLSQIGYFFIFLTFKVYILIAIIQEVKIAIGDQSKFNTFLLIIVTIWSLCAVIYSTRIFVTSLLYRNLLPKHHRKTAAGDILIMLGTIYFAALVIPIVYIFNLFKKCKKPKRSEKKYIKFLKTLYNGILSIFAVLTLRQSSKHLEFAIQYAFIHNKSYLHSSRQSHAILSREHIMKLHKSNVTKIVFVPSYIPFIAGSKFLIDMTSFGKNNSNVALMTLITYSIILIEFFYSTCETHLFLFADKSDLYYEKHKHIYELFINEESRGNQGASNSVIVLPRVIDDNTNHEITKHNG